MRMTSDYREDKRSAHAKAWKTSKYVVRLILQNIQSTSTKTKRVISGHYLIKSANQLMINPEK